LRGFEHIENERAISRLAHQIRIINTPARKTVTTPITDRASYPRLNLPWPSPTIPRQTPQKALATFRRKKPFSDDRATILGARTRRQVAADKL
jgi:hypothetical protein